MNILTSSLISFSQVAFGQISLNGLPYLSRRSLKVQEKLLRENGAIEIYQDSFTGTKMDRPNFDKLLSKLQKGDTL